MILNLVGYSKISNNSMELTEVLPVALTAPAING